MLRDPPHFVFDTISKNKDTSGCQEKLGKIPCAIISFIHARVAADRPS